MQAYTFKSINQDVLKKSRSGGIFTFLSDEIINKNGVVYGAILDDTLFVRHFRSTTKFDRDKMRGSKYVQSYLGSIFSNVVNDLKNGKYVLFSGTACQVSGLLSFCKILHINTQNLYTIDILCHGVPSPKIYKDYLEWYERKYKDAILNFDFRNKIKYGWHDHKETIYMENHTVDSNKYASLFYSSNITRPSCFTCKYKTLDRISDITIGDAWKLNNDSENEFFGVSLVLLNTEKGRNLFDLVKQFGDHKKININDYMQQALKKPYEMPNTRKKFWYLYKNKGLEFYLNDTFIYKIKRYYYMKIKKFSNSNENIRPKNELLDIPSLFGEENECCGCTACLNVCPKNAIMMKENEEGFLYPTIDKNKCVNCKLCVKVCDFKIDNNYFS